MNGDYTRKIKIGYTLDDIFEKKLYALIPYYLLKYEKKKDIVEESDKDREKLLEDYREIADRLIKVMEEDQTAGYVSVLLDLVNDTKQIIRSLFHSGRAPFFMIFSRTFLT